MKHPAKIAVTASAALFVAAMAVVAPSANAATPITYTYAGDSVTATNNAWSWTRYLDDADLSSVGGTAISGAASPTVLDNLDGPIDADVLVVMVGTNDVRFGYTEQSVRSNIAAMTYKVKARHVVIAALPPSNLDAYAAPGVGTIDRTAKGFSMNRSLQDLAASRGWLFVDPFSDVRRMDGKWSGGADAGDGVHPSVATAQNYVGHRMAVAIRQAVEGAKP